jgi:Transcriptional regulator PadR-like family
VGSTTPQGCLELAILAALWDGRRYGLEILRRLETDSDLIVPEGTIYPLLQVSSTEGSAAGSEASGTTCAFTCPEAPLTFISSLGGAMRAQGPEILSNRHSRTIQWSALSHAFQKTRETRGNVIRQRPRSIWYMAAQKLGSVRGDGFPFPGHHRRDWWRGCCRHG